MIPPAASRRLHSSFELSGQRSATLSRAFAICSGKALSNIKRLADEPKSGAFAQDGNYFEFNEGFFEIGNWTSSFFTGMALLAYRVTRDTRFLEPCDRLKSPYHEKVFTQNQDTMHDLGFLYTLYSESIYKLTGDPGHRIIALRAAEELSKRFVPAGGYIRAWGRMDELNTAYAGLAIIDCLMNLPLLFWAAEESENSSYRDIATRHATTVLTHFVRPDNSVCHAYRFDPKTGAALHEDNFCARTVDSQWARGTTWAFNGFALCYRYTKDEKFLDAAVRIARRFVEQLDAEVVPVWDFHLPPGEPRLRDSSAAAIAVCGLDQICRLRPDETALANAAEALLDRLCAPEYLDERLECPGVLKRAQVGDGVGKARAAYASWGDYFFMEALTRRLHGEPDFW
ncbi:MAG TPA: glycoside hydrolase family 88 protein [Opitutaceae bacterium]|nr:glycoside hydrolase family 88 protein [Opitutaceae bacterium]